MGGACPVGRAARLRRLPVRRRLLPRGGKKKKKKKKKKKSDGSSRADGSGHPAWYRPNGNLEWADSAEGHAELTARVRRLTEWGYPATLVDAAAAAELEPSLRLPPSVTEVAWFPEEGYLLT